MRLRSVLLLSQLMPTVSFLEAPNSCLFAGIEQRISLVNIHVRRDIYGEKVSVAALISASDLLKDMPIGQPLILCDPIHGNETVG